MKTVKQGILYFLLFVLAACHDFDLNNSDCELSDVKEVAVKVAVAVELSNPQFNNRKIELYVTPQCCDGKTLAEAYSIGYTEASTQTISFLQKSMQDVALTNSNDYLVVTARLYDPEGQQYSESQKIYNYLEATNAEKIDGSFVKHCSFSESDFVVD